MPLKSIQNQRRRLSDAAYDQMKAAIIGGEFRTGDDLVQERLAEELQISRTPVREALLRLEQEGVIEASRRGSYRLRRLSTPEIRELYQARAAIEGQTARTLAAVSTPDMAAQLRRDILAEDQGAGQAAHYAMHRCFVLRAGNRYLLEMFDMIWSQAMAFQLFSTSQRLQASDHLPLVDVVETGDRNAALEAFSAHIQDEFDQHMDALSKAETN